MRKAIILAFLLLCGVAAGQVGLFRSFSTGEVTPDLFGRTDIRLPGSRELENMFVWPHGPVEKRPGTYWVAEVAEGELSGETPGVPGNATTYAFTILSENGVLWYVPLGDGELSVAFGGDAIDEGGGNVGISIANSPFETGDVAVIYGTTNYDGTHTLVSGTSTSKVVFADTYVAETFDGTEGIVKKLTGLEAGAGYMVGDSDHNIYYGGDRGSDGGGRWFVDKIEPDGTITHDYDFLDTNWSGAGSNRSVRGMAISDDDQYLYFGIFIDAPTDTIEMYKYDLTTGNLVWGDSATWGQWGSAIDADGNAYHTRLRSQNAAAMFDADTGSPTLITNSQGVYNCLVDDDMGIMITAGLGSDGSKMWVSVLGEATVADEIFGGDRTFSAGHIRIDGDYIYTLNYDNGDVTHVLSKYSWDGAQLVLQASANGPPDHALEIYFDIYGNLVVCRQDDTVTQRDVFWFYDPDDLSLLSKVDNMPTMFRAWDAAVGGAWIHGEVVFDGVLAGVDTPAIPAVTIPPVEPNGVPARLIPFVKSSEIARVIEAGHQYMRFYKDVP